MQVEDKNDAFENPTLLVSRQLHSPGGILQGILHSNPPQYIKVNEFLYIYIYTNYANHTLKINLYTCIGVTSEVPITEGVTNTSDTATSNGNFHNAGIESADTTSTLDSDAVHTLPADTMTTLDSDVVHTLPADTMTTLDSDAVHTLPADTMTTLDSDVVHTLPADTMTTLDSDVVHTLPADTMTTLILMLYTHYLWRNAIFKVADYLIYRICTMLSKQSVNTVLNVEL